MYSPIVRRISSLSFRKHPLSIPRPWYNPNYAPITRIPRRSFFYSTGTRSIYIVQSSSTTSIAIVAVAATFWGSIVIYEYLSSTGDVIAQQKDLDLTQNEELHAIMTGEPLPGRPGNLTAEQEVILKEFWGAVLSVFGVHDTTNGTNGDTTTTEGQQALKDADKRSRADTAGSEKKPKKRKGLFSRKKDDDETNDGETNSVSATDGEDKYGQHKDFAKVLETQDPEDLRKAFWSMVKHDNPDALLLRFLRARKWHAQNALVMLVATMHWRAQEMHVDDDIMRRGEGGALEDSTSGATAAVKKEGEDFLNQMRMGKSFLHGNDVEGRPICMVRVKLHRQGEQSESSLERYTVYTIETARLMLSGNVDTAAIVFDMTDFSMANMDYGPVKFMIKCFEANYPESLGVVLVHKAPWIFQGIYKIIRNWLDPVVASKIHFTKTPADLSAYIPLAHIPTSLGGTEPFTYTYTPPSPSENALLSHTETRDTLLAERADAVKQYEAATLDWIHGREPQRGYDDGVQGRRRELAGRLREGYWILDRYVRARSLYDRVGVLGEGGVADWSKSGMGVEGAEAGGEGKAEEVAVAVGGTGGGEVGGTVRGEVDGGGMIKGDGAVGGARGADAGKLVLSEGPIAAGHRPEELD